MTHSLLLENERIDQFIGGDIQIIQSPEVFLFHSTPFYSHILHVSLNAEKSSIYVFGNGAVGLFISSRTSATITGVEIQARLADMAQRSIQLNQLETQLNILNIDLKETTQYIDKDSVDAIVCNPPYFKELPTNTKTPILI